MGHAQRRFVWMVSLALFLIAAFARHGVCAEPTAPRLTFDELVTLSKTGHGDARLEARLKSVLTTPVVHNLRSPSAASGSHPLRVTEWNIERGQKLTDLVQLLKTPDAFLAHAQQEGKLSAAKLKQLKAQADMLRSSDVLLLNEVDIGVKRTDYQDVVDVLAKALGMSSAYAVEFVEVDELTDLGTEAAVLDTPQLSARMTEDLKPDRNRFRGLHVNAILSRYPLQNARVIELPACYDWYADEKAGISQLEKAKRKTANLLFLERLQREVRRGNRNALVADIMPHPGATPVRLVDTHLENRCKASCRNDQMKYLLHTLSDTPGALVLGGDLNTTGTDGTPTSVRYELGSRVKDYQFWVGTLLRFTPAGLPVYATAPFSFWKNFRDPTAMHVPVIGKNPEAGLFKTMRDFRFDDKNRFDFRGSSALNRQRSSKTLSDSDERATKGFVPTFSMQRDFGGLIKYRLDWLLVKPLPSSTNEKAKASQTLEPTMPSTLNDLNAALPVRLSDHAPISVEIR